MRLLRRCALRNDGMPLIFIAISVMLLFGAEVASQDWASCRASSDGSSHQWEVAYPPLTHQWSYETFAKITAGPVAAYGRIFIGNHAGAFYCFDALTGDVVWQFSAGMRIDSTACCYDGAVYFGSRDGFVYALDADDGTVLWSRSLGTTIISSPKIYDGKLFIGEGSPSNGILALDAATGQMLGFLESVQPVQSSLCFLGDRFFMSSNDGALYCGDTSSYLQNWKYQTIGSFDQSSPAVSGNSVFISPGHDGRRIYRLDINTGIKLSESDELVSTACRASSVAICDDVVYASKGWSAVKLFALDAANLKKIWEYGIGGITGENMVPAPTLTQNCVYTGTFDGKLIVLKQQDISPSGELLYENSISGASILSQVCVSNGWVYAGLDEGTLKAYKAAEIAAIALPRENDVISGAVTVKGTVILQNMQYFTLLYGSGSEPSEWTSIAVKYGSFDNADITEWIPDTADGLYTLKIEASVSGSTLDLTSRVLLTVNLPPDAPEIVSVADASNGLAISWNLSGDDGSGDNDVAQYRIYRSTISGVYQTYLDFVGNGTNSYTDTTIQQARQYYYTVKAYDGLSESAASNEDYNVLTLETDWISVPRSSGGEVSLPDGTKVTVPKDAFDEDVYIKVKILQEDEYTQTDTNMLFNPAGAAREFSVITNAQINSLSGVSVSEQSALIETFSSSIVFNKLVTITIPYKLNEIEGMDESRLNIALWNGGESRWRINETSDPDPDSNTIQALVNHFSTYQIVENAWVYVSNEEGGTVELLDGTKAVVKPGTFGEGSWMSIKPLVAGEYADSGLDPRFNATGAVRQFHVLTNIQMNAVKAVAVADLPQAVNEYSASVGFSETLTIVIPYTEEQVSGMDESRLRIVWYDERVLEWKMVNTSAPDPDNLNVKARVSHFTDYRIIEFAPAGDLLQKQKVYTYPNPATGNSLVFKLYLGDDAFITIDVYNVAGERVAHLAGEGQAGLVAEIEWDIRKYASGIYIYAVEAKQKSGNSKKKIIKKLAIIK